MELADKCQTRSQTVQNEQFASECASLVPPSKCWLSILWWFQINAIAPFFSPFYVNFPLIKAAYLTVTQLHALKHLWFHDLSGLINCIMNSATVFQLKQDDFGMGVMSAVQQLQDLITISSYEQDINKNKGQKEELDASDHPYLNWTHHSRNESWMPGKLLSLFLG